MFQVASEKLQFLIPFYSFAQERSLNELQEPITHYI